MNKIISIEEDVLPTEELIENADKLIPLKPARFVIDNTNITNWLDKLKIDDSTFLIIDSAFFHSFKQETSQTIDFGALVDFIPGQKEKAHYFSPEPYGQSSGLNSFLIHLSYLKNIQLVKRYIHVVHSGQRIRIGSMAADMITIIFDKMLMNDKNYNNLVIFSREKDLEVVLRYIKEFSDIKTTLFTSNYLRIDHNLLRLADDTISAEDLFNAANCYSQYK